MDFAKKQMEKFGWKEGTGLGKNEQGILSAIKPTLKVGKEGMGYDFSKELVDTWWTRAYDDSLKRINVDVDSSTMETVGVVLQDDEDDKDNESLVKDKDSSSERPFQKMKKRMMKATFTTFSKGATLSNGELIGEEQASDSDHSDDKEDGNTKTNAVKSLTDEELLKACGGRTAHKAARFGLKLNGKLARIEAQEKSTKSFLSKYTCFKTSKADDESPTTEPEDNLSKKDLKKKKKKSKKDKTEEQACAEDEFGPSSTSLTPPSSDLPMNSNNDVDAASTTDPEGRKKKKKSSKKRKYESLEEQAVDSMLNNKDDAKEDSISEEYDLSSIKTHTKKSKNKKSKYNKADDDESCALLS